MSRDRYQRYAPFREEVHKAIDVLLEHWKKHSTEFDEWELEVRLGRVLRQAPPPPEVLMARGPERLLPVRDRGFKFGTDVMPQQFYAMFDHLARSAARDAHSVSESVYDMVHQYGDSRVVHAAECSEQSKKAVRPHADFERSLADNVQMAFDVRISTCTESSHTLTACDCQPRKPETRTVNRQRRSVVLHDAEHWRIDFTRLNYGAEHQIEIELLWVQAYTQLSRAYERMPEKPPGSFNDCLRHWLCEELINVIDTLNTIVLGLPPIPRL